MLQFYSSAGDGQGRGECMMYDGDERDEGREKQGMSMPMEAGLHKRHKAAQLTGGGQT